MLDHPDLVARCSVIQRKLVDRLGTVLERYPIDSYIQNLRSISEVGKYQLRDSNVFHVFNSLSEQDSSCAQMYNATAVVMLIRSSATEILDMGLTADVIQLCYENFDRILDNVESGEITYMTFPSDQFDKDLSAALLHLVCVGAQKIHKVHFPNHSVKRHPITWFRIVRQVGYRGILYEMHTDSNDPNLMEDFSETGWTDFYRRVAALLEKNQVQGVIGSSWFFDPTLETISPRLSYLRRIVVGNGGISVRGRSDESSVESATRTSPTRRDLYQAGEYQPTSYTLVWPRSALISWANQK